MNEAAMTRILRWIGYVLLLSILAWGACAADAHYRQGPKWWWKPLVSEPVARDGTRVLAIEPEDTPEFREAIRHVATCTGLEIPEQTWMLRQMTVTTEGDSVFGEWVEGDTIFVSSILASGDDARTWWVIEHELIHAALRGPPDGGPHPLTPFQFPCKRYFFPK